MIYSTKAEWTPIGWVTSYYFKESEIKVKEGKKIGYKTITIEKNTLTSHKERELIIICPGFNKNHVRAEILNYNELHFLKVYFLNLEEEREDKYEFDLNWQDTIFESFTVEDGVLRIVFPDVPVISYIPS